MALKRHEDPAIDRRRKYYAQAVDGFQDVHHEEDANKNAKSRLVVLVVGEIIRDLRAS